MVEKSQKNNDTRVALLIDSLRVNREIIAFQLELSGWQVIHADSCTTAIVALIREQIDLLLFASYTVAEPELEFTELIEAYEAREQRLIPKIIIQSGSEDTETPNGCCTICPPVSVSAVNAAIAHALETTAGKVIPIGSPAVRAAVLVVDDTPENLDYMDRVLSKVNAQVALAESGQEAVAMIEAGRDFVLIFMDIQMPGMSGYTALKRIRELGRTMPVIALTAQEHSDENIRHFEEAGFDRFLSKPVMINDVIEVANHYIQCGSLDKAS